MELRNSFEGTDGTNITTSTPGTGDALEATTVAASTTLKFSTTQFAHGASSAQIVNGAGNTVTTVVERQGLGISSGSDLWWRGYIWAPALANASWTPLRFRTAAATTCGDVRTTAANVFRAFNAAGTASGTAGTTTYPAAGWCRLEGRIRPSTTAGELEWWLFNTMDAPIGSHDDHDVATGLVLGADVDAVRFGFAASGPIGWTAYFDDQALSTIGQIGPYSSGAPPTITNVRAGTFDIVLVSNSWF